MNFFFPVIKISKYMSDLKEEKQWLINLFPKAKE